MLLVDLLVKANVAIDKSVARRLMAGGMVSFNNVKHTNIEKQVKPKVGDVLKVGSNVTITLTEKEINENEDQI